MEPDLAKRFNLLNFGERYEKIPTRIFMDTNIIQYLGTYGEFIFENYFEDDIFLDQRGEELSPFLINEINSLRILLLGIDRSPFHFAFSLNIYNEVQKKGDASLSSYFLDLYQYWQSIVWDLGNAAFSGAGKGHLRTVKTDTSIIGALSKKDFHVFCDAVELECNAILTCDKFRKRQNWIYDKYNIMVLSPTDLLEIMKDFQGLYC